MRRTPRGVLGVLVVLCLGLCLPVVAACGARQAPRSSQSFDEIARRVERLSAAEVGSVLGAPDSRQSIYLRDERWIWWNYTFLDGDDYPPESRGRVVHLEITFRKPESTPPGKAPPSQWRIAEPYGIAFRKPGEDRSEAHPNAASVDGRASRRDGEAP